MSILRGLIRNRSLFASTRPHAGASQTNIITGELRSWDDAHLWSGVLRGCAQVPTVVITFKPRSWSLPLSLSFMCHLLTKPGVTIGVLCFYVSWGWM